MSEHPLMSLLLDANSFVGASESVEDEIMPLDDQLNFGPGDTAILAGANTPLESEFCVLRAVDPEKHADIFPDWEERTMGTGEGWNSYVLCEVFSRNDPEISLGWFSRLKILPIPKNRFKQCQGWRTRGFPRKMPDWTADIYQQYTDALSKNAPAVVPKRATCPDCGGRDVDLVVTAKLVYNGRVGVVTRNGEDVYIPITDPRQTEKHDARLICTDCGRTTDLSDDDWEMPR